MSTTESISARRQRTLKILKLLHKQYLKADCALKHKNAWQLLISTILSAQSTDENTNRVAQSLYKKYRKPADFVSVPLQELEQDIHSTGFFRQKAKNIQKACAMIVNEYEGKVPDTMEDLIRLPGVARKTANVILGTWYGKNEGIVVDTHVGRLSERLKLHVQAKDSKDAVRIERELMEVVPCHEWTYFAHALILHGRQVCQARKPQCGTCVLAAHCPSAELFSEKPAPRQRKVSGG